MRMRRRRPDMTCTSCKGGDCLNCTDVVRSAYGLPDRCTCTRPLHSGEIHHDGPSLANGGTVTVVGDGYEVQIDFHNEDDD